MKKFITYLMVSILFVTSLCFNVAADTEEPVQNPQQFTVTIGEGTDSDLGFVTTSLEGESVTWSKQVTVNPGTNVYLKVESQEGKTFGKWTVTGGYPGIEKTQTEGIYILYHVSNNLTVNEFFLTGNQKMVNYYVQNIYVNYDWQWGDSDGIVGQTRISKSKEDVSHSEVYIRPMRIQDEQYKDYVVKPSYIKVNKYNAGTGVIGEEVPAVMNSDSSNSDSLDYVFANHPMQGGGDVSYYFEGSWDDVLVTYIFKPKGASEISFSYDDCKAYIDDVEGKFLTDPDKIVKISAPATRVVEGETLVFGYWHSFVDGYGPISGDNYGDIYSNETTVSGITADTIFYPIYKSAENTTTRFVSETWRDGVLYNSKTSGYKIGGVDGIGVGLRDTEFDDNSDTNKTYKLEKSELAYVDSEGKDVVLQTFSTKQTTDTFFLSGKVPGLYNRYQNDTTIPDGYSVLKYKAYYTSSAEVDKSKNEIIADAGIKYASNDFDKNRISAVVPTADAAAPDETEYYDIAKAVEEDEGNRVGIVSSVAKYYDLSLVAQYRENGTEKAVNITELGDEVQYTVFLSEEEVKALEGVESVKIARVHEGETDLLDATVDGNRLTFKTNKFSTYALISYEKSNLTGSALDSYKEICKSDNAALKYNTQISSPEFTILTVAPISSEAKSDYGVVTEMSFNVVPLDQNGEEVHILGNKIKFRLPVDGNADLKYANVYHNGTFIDQYTVKTDGTNKYIEVEADNFSIYSYKLTNTEYVVPSAPSAPSSNSYRKPVVNTSVK